LEKTDWHATEVDDVLKALETGREGITDEEADRRLEVYGPNELKEEKKKQWYHLLFEQFTSILVIIRRIRDTIHSRHECHLGLRPRVPGRAGRRGS